MCQIPQKPVTRATEWHQEPYTGAAVALTYEAARGYHHVRAYLHGMDCEPECWRFETADEAREWWCLLRAELRERGFRRVRC